MATAIVPHTETVRPADLLTAYYATYAEVYSLALFLCEEDDLPLSQAMRAAADDLGYCLEYAEAWDRTAFLAGNDDACPF